MRTQLVNLVTLLSIAAICSLASVNSFAERAKDYLLIQNKNPVPEKRKYYEFVKNCQFKNEKKCISYRKTKTKTYFNGIERKGIYDIHISGLELTIDKTNDYLDLFKNLHLRENIRSLNIYAETLVIADQLHLPGTNVYIYAHTLRFKDRAADKTIGSIDTTPIKDRTRPKAARFSGSGCTDPIAPSNAKSGQIAGAIQLFVSTLKGAPKRRRLIARGGQGQAAALGAQGCPGIDLSNLALKHAASGPGGALCTIIINKSSLLPGTLYFKTCKGAGALVSPGCSNGSTHWPTNGTPASAGGLPGLPGMGGKIVLTVPISPEMIDNRGGSPGEIAPTAIGGAPGLPNPAIHMYVGCPGQPSVTKNYVKGADARGPKLTQIVPGRFQGKIVLSKNKSALWLRAATLQLMAEHLEDSFRAGNFRYVAHRSAEILSWVSSQRTANQKYKELTERETAEINAIAIRIEGIWNKVKQNLDFYGKPGGWTPRFSLATNVTLFKSEVENAIRLIYTTYWIEDLIKRRKKRIIAIDTAIEQLKKSKDKQLLLFSSLEEQRQVLSSRLSSLNRDVSIFTRLVRSAEERLKTMAENTVQQRLKKKKRFSLLKRVSMLANVIPIYQPALSSIGKGVESISAISKAKNPSQVASMLSDTYSSLKGLTFSVDGKTSPKEFLKSLPFDNKKNALSSFKKIQKYYNRVKKPIRSIIRSRSKFGSPKNEVDKEFQILKSRDSSYIKIINLAKNISEKRAIISQSLSRITSQYDNAIEQYMSAGVSIDKLRRHKFEIGAESDHNLLMTVRSIRRNSLARLQEYQYRLNKSYAFSMLQPMSFNSNIRNLLFRVKSLVETNKGAGITKEQLESTFVLYQSELRKTIMALIRTYDKFGNPFKQVITITLSRTEINNLRKTGSLRIDVNKEIPANFENVRLLNVSLDANISSKTGVRSGRIFIHTLEPSFSIIRWQGQKFYFRHPTDYNQRAISYGGVWNAANGKFVQNQKNPEFKNVIEALIGKKLSARLGFSPSARGDLLLRYKEVGPGSNEFDVRGLSVTLKITAYESK